MKKAAKAADNAPSARAGKAGGGGSKTTRRGKDNGSRDNVCSLARSFGGDTLVLMADGTRKRIKDIKIGGKVLATDPETGEQTAKVVTHLWVHHDDLTALILDVDADGDGQLDRLVTTEDHPFWNATDGVWEGPEDITPGDVVLTDQWRRIEVVGLDPGTTHRDLAYNLTVDGIHTYHVGTSDVLVHNTGDGCGTGNADSPEINAPYKRPSNATNRVQRESVHGKPCVDCGNIADKQVADHIEPLVEEYYRTGAIELDRMRSLEAVQPQCPVCSASQGGRMSWYSRRMRDELGLE